jgi:hypothetical protein
VNVRFWVWINGGWVRLTLRPGQTLEHCKHCRTDEGWSAEWTRWTHDWDQVVRESVSDGRDCDGRLTEDWMDFCPFERLDQLEYSHWASDCHNGVPIRSPAWEEYGPGRVYDEYAQAANY